VKQVLTSGCVLWRDRDEGAHHSYGYRGGGPVQLATAVGPVLQPTFAMADMDAARHEQKEQAARAAGMCEICLSDPVVVCQ